MTEQMNANRIEQTIRLTRSTLEHMLNLDQDVKALMGINVKNFEESNRVMLDVIERKIKNIIESKVN